MMESTQAFYSTSLLFWISSLKQTDSKITILYFFSFLESNHNAHLISSHNAYLSYHFFFPFYRTVTFPPIKKKLKIEIKCKLLSKFWLKKNITKWLEGEINWEGKNSWQETEELAVVCRGRRHRWKGQWAVVRKCKYRLHRHRWCWCSVFVLVGAADKQRCGWFGTFAPVLRSWTPPH